VVTEFLANRFDELAARARLPFRRIEPLHGQRRLLGDRESQDGRAWLELELRDPDLIWLSLCDDVVVDYSGKPEQTLPAVLEIARTVFWEPVSIVYPGGFFADTYALFALDGGETFTLPDRRELQPPTTWLRKRYRPISGSG